MIRKFTPMQFFLASFFTLLSGISLQAQSYKWQALKMGGAGFVSGIITSKQQPNLIYARTDVGGAYRWNVADSSWIPLQDWTAADQQGFMGVESLAIDPQANNKLYMLVGIDYFQGGKSAILKSDNYGQTFTTIETTTQFKAHGNGVGRSNGERLQVDPNLGSTLYVGTRYNGLFKSTDAGLTWSRLAGLNVTTTSNNNGISFVLIDPSSGTPGTASQKIYVGVSRYDTLTGNPYNLFVSTDAGATFNPVIYPATDGPTGGLMPQRAVRTSAGDLIINYANGAGPGGGTYNGVSENMNRGGIYKYTPATNTWANITPAGIVRAWGGLSVDPANPARMIASTINNYQLQYATPGPPGTGAYGDRIYLTTNGGATWTDVVSRGFYLNTNGADWIYGQAIHWAGSIEFDPFNTNRVLVTSGNGVFRNDSIDVAAAQWKFDVKGLEETVPTALISIPEGPLFATIGDYDGFKYTDINKYGERLRPTMGTTTGIVYAGLNTNKLVRVGSKIYVSNNQGLTWDTTVTIIGARGKIAVTADGSALVHCPDGSSTIYYSNNNGATWTGALNGAGPALFGLSNAIPIADMVNPQKVYLYNNGSGNFSISTNGGASFSVVQGIGGGGNKLMRAIPGLEGHIWVAAGTNGLKRTTNSGTTFTTIAGITNCAAVGYGKAAPGATYLTIYIWGTINGITGIYRSVNEGSTWVRINDDANQFGGPGNAQFVTGDMNTYGTVYMSTVGRSVIVGQISTPLPVALAGLNVREAIQSGRPVAMLNWKTLTENNVSHFTIERSTNTQAWSPVATVTTKATNGTSTAALNYTYPDDIAGLNGMVYYRLKMVDKNGAYVYGNTVSLNIGKPVKGLTVAVSPNPVEAATGAIVRFTSEKNERVMLKVVGQGGVLLASRTMELQAGNTSVTLTELVNKPSGMYLLNVISASTNKSVSTVRFVIPKN